MAQSGSKMKVHHPLDEAMARALMVKPPARGWPNYKARLKRLRERREELAKAPQSKRR